MKLSTGKVAIPIEFDNGDKQNIYFNPNDPDLMIRMNNLGEKVHEKIKGLDDFVSSIMQILSDYTSMEEGFMLAPPKNNSHTKKLASMIDNELQII